MQSLWILVVLTTLLEACLSQCFPKTLSRVVPSSGSCPSGSVVEDQLNQLQNEVNAIIDREFPILQDLASLQSVSGCPGDNWRKVAEVNSSLSCPNGTVKETEGDVNYCRLDRAIDCQSLIYLTPKSIGFSEICFTVKGYQIGLTSGFSRLSNSIDENYLDGISITHGYPRTHIWSFASGIGAAQFSCPCNASSGEPSQQNALGGSIGRNYSCDSSSGVNIPIPNQLFTDGIWHDSGCLAGGCCRSSPYFYRELTMPTCDDLEVRLCQDKQTSTVGTIGLDSLELYVK